MSDTPTLTDDEGCELPATDELIALFTDVLPHEVVEELRACELDRFAAYLEVWRELQRLGWTNPQIENCFELRGLLDHVDQAAILKGIDPNGGLS